MKIRRFFAKDMRSALNQVSAELGPDAAILSSSNVNGGVEVVAATDYEEALMQSRQSARPNRAATEHSQPIQQTDAQKAKPSASESGLLSFLKQQEKKQDKSLNHYESSVKKKAAQQANSNSRFHAEANDTFETPVPESPKADDELAQPFPKIEWSQEPTLVAMREELSLLRNLLQEQVSKLAWDKQSQLSPIAVALKREFTNLGLSHSIIDPIGQVCEQEQDFECAWQKGLALLAKQIQVGEDDILSQGGVVAFVGPTGVGKTTTLAKLAAKHVIKYGPESIGLITTDNFRIAAHEQIKTFGRILKVPVRIAGDEKSLKDALYHFEDKRMVLIDTAGMSQHDERMSQLMQCLSQDYRKIRNYLVLSATSQRSVLNGAIKLFKPFDLTGTIVTKLDEAASLGEIISTIIDNQLNVVYTTDGQRVPEDIRVARAHHLVSKMVWLTRQSQNNSQNNEATGTH